MPYSIKKGSGPRPYKIIRVADGAVVGTSVSRAIAQRSIGHRMSAEPATKNIKQFKRKVNNKLRSYGETDLQKKVVTINKSKRKNGRGEILDTIVHEKKHVQHPKMKEKTVRKATAKTLKSMTRKTKQQHYNLFKG